MREMPTKPRSTPARAVLAGLLVLAVVAAWLAVRHLLILKAVGNNPAGDALSIITPALITGWLATKVSYRWIDGLWWLIPIVGVFLLAKIAWRLTLLPYRDWPPRSNEVARRHNVNAQGSQNKPLYILAK